MRYAIVRAGRVENIVVADERYSAAKGTDAVALDDGAAVSVGWTHSGGAFTPPPPPPPSPDMADLDILEGALAATPVDVRAAIEALGRLALRQAGRRKGQ